MAPNGVDGLISPALREGLFELRHDLHRHPELAFHEERTADRLASALDRMGAGDVKRVAGTGLVTRIPGRSSAAPLVAIRGDIDALPIHEETGVEFASVHDGVMHACGHDVHASWAVGAAALLADSPAAGDVLIVLQPAEELGRGASAMIDAGVLDGVRAIFGAHVDLRLALGEVVAEAGALAGSTDEFRIEVIGRGGHAARPHETLDSIVAAAGVIAALQQIVSRRLPPGAAGVVTVGTINAGTAPNVIPDRAVLTGTLRALTPQIRALLQEEVQRAAQAAAATYGTRAEVTIEIGTPPIVNLPGPVAWARDAVRAVLGDAAFVQLPVPNLGGEDFAFYLERVEGCFLRIGGRPPDTEPVPAHTSRFLPDDRAVLVGAAVLAETARRASAALAG